jgi:hypothetical protein
MTPQDHQGGDCEAQERDGAQRGDDEEGAARRGLGHEHADEPRKERTVENITRRAGRVGGIGQRVHPVCQPAGCMEFDGGGNEGDGVDVGRQQDRGGRQELNQDCDCRNPRQRERGRDAKRLAVARHAYTVCRGRIGKMHQHYLVYSSRSPAPCRTTDTRIPIVGRVIGPGRTE